MMNFVEVAEEIRETLMAVEDSPGTDPFGGIEVSEENIDVCGHMADFFVRVDGREFRVRVTEVAR